MLGWLSCAQAAAPPDPRLEALGLVPKDAVALFNIPSIQALEADLKRFSRETGWQIGRGDHPALDVLAHRTGISEGLDAAGSACVAFMDPKKFRERYTVYILPVADWDSLLKSTAGEEMMSGLYALTGTQGPRFVLRRGKFAVITSSIRTLDALADAAALAPTLRPETLARAASGPMIYLNIRQLKDIYEREIASWFRAATGQVYHEPQAVPYADMFVTYMLGIAAVLDQMETGEAVLRFGPDGLGADLSVRFLEKAGVAEFLSAQVPGAAPLPAVTDRPVTSEATLTLDPASRTDLLLRATKFFLESAPRPEPLPEHDKKSIAEAVETFANSLGEHATFLSAPAAPGMGMFTDVTVLDLKDPAQFRHGLELLVASFESLAEQLNLYMKFKASPETAQVAGVDVTSYVPQLRWGVPARHVEFRERLRGLYGPEGLIYRIAVVGHQAVICTGSDLSLFRETIERLKAGKEPGPSPAVRRLETHVPAKQNVFVALNLPMFIGQALERGGTPADRIGTIDPGHEVAGVGIHGGSETLQVTSYWPHEQIRLARELLNRAAPDIAEGTKSLFEPTPEGPPKPEGTKPPAPKVGTPKPQPPRPPPVLGPGLKIPPPVEKPRPIKPQQGPAADKPKESPSPADKPTETPPAEAPKPASATP
jgi:hypothetical protein